MVEKVHQTRVLSESSEQPLLGFSEISQPVQSYQPGLRALEEKGIGAQSGENRLSPQLQTLTPTKSKTSTNDLYQISDRMVIILFLL